MDFCRPLDSHLRQASLGQGQLEPGKIANINILLPPLSPCLRTRPRQDRRGRVLKQGEGGVAGGAVPQDDQSPKEEHFKIAQH